MVDADRHGRYAELIRAFEAKTIKTSFSISGEPIVGPDSLTGESRSGR